MSSFSWKEMIIKLLIKTSRVVLTFAAWFHIEGAVRSFEGEQPPYPFLHQAKWGRPDPHLKNSFPINVKFCRVLETSFNVLEMLFT